MSYVFFWFSVFWNMHLVFWVQWGLETVSWHARQEFVATETHSQHKIFFEILVVEFVNLHIFFIFIAYSFQNI